MQLTLKRAGLKVLLYVGLAVGSLVVFAFFFWLVVIQLGAVLSMKWFYLGGETVLVFGTVTSAWREEWHRRRFWVALFLLAAVHSVAFSYALIHLHFVRWPLIWFLGVGFLEIVPINAVLGWAVPKTTKHRPGRNAGS